jgi:hypothetical protein
MLSIVALPYQAFVISHPRDVYRVVVTPDGDTRGLYVAAKTPTGFTARESQGGHSTVTFDYRIVATQLGQIGRRMSTAITPKLHLPPASRRAPKTAHRPAMPPIPKLVNRR